MLKMGTRDSTKDERETGERGGMKGKSMRRGSTGQVEVKGTRLKGKEKHTLKGV